MSEQEGESGVTHHEQPASAAGSRRGTRGSERAATNATSSRRAFLGLAGAGAATVLAGCISGSSGESTPSVSYRHRFKRIGLVPSLHDAGVELGTWKEAGLDVDFKTSTGAQATAKAVANGEDDFGDGGMKIVLNAIENGAPLVIIGQELDPIRGIVALADSDIDSWTDLEGKTIGKMPFAMSKVSKEILRQKGVDVSTVTF
ncbi:MAG: ABC transporter substrate-binding protein, partial [Halanaeroarchaeum sp.]